MAKLYLAIIILAVLGGAGFGAYMYYKDTQERIAILTENNAKLEMALAQSEEAIKSLEADMAAANEEIKKTNAAFAEIRRQNNRLSQKLGDMDLGAIAAEKPDSIERAINRGTVNAGRCFEILSGSPLTEDEKNATDGETFNKECPWLWPGPTTGGMSGESATSEN